MVRSHSIVDELAPAETFAAMISEPSAAMVDVRTRAEWSFVGIPDISETGKPFWPVEWVSFPQMMPNSRFLEDLSDRADGDLPDRIFFICRSGARSMMAARTVAAAMEAQDRPLHCTNVAEGFEGDLDAENHRGARNGWKARGLPWRQS